MGAAGSRNVSTLPDSWRCFLIKAEPTSFGITIELLMLSSAAAIVGGLYVGTQSTGEGADYSSKIGTLERRAGDGVACRGAPIMCDAITIP